MSDGKLHSVLIKTEGGEVVALVAGKTFEDRLRNILGGPQGWGGKLVRSLTGAPLWVCVEKIAAIEDLEGDGDADKR